MEHERLYHGLIGRLRADVMDLRLPFSKTLMGET